ncbi:MAG: DUF4270 domain-containing protein [Flavobacteriaceae bacterium]
MKKTLKALQYPIVFLLVVSSFIACDKDFANIDSDVIGEGNTNFSTSSEYVNITAYNRKFGHAQINGLPANLLGVYNDPAYGQTTANIVAQIAPSSFDPDFGDNPEIDSVVLTIPYYYRTVTDSTYTISDSLYGDGESPIKLSIFENKYFLRDFNPADGGSQYYYSDAESASETNSIVSNGTTNIDFDSFKGDLIYSNENFVPSPDRITLNTYDDEDEIASTEYLAPSFRDTLSRAFWKAAIIDKQDDVVLSNSSNFLNYFRGLYLKTEASTYGGNMILLNLASTSANIVIYYSKDSSTEGERTQSTYTLTFSGYKLNTFSNTYTQTLADGNPTDGDELLYLKGGEGAIGIVDLFTGQAEYNGEYIDAIDAFKKTYRQTDKNGNYITDENGNFKLKRLINDAVLTVYEYDQLNTGSYGSNYHRYDRLYAYDVKNNAPTTDYTAYSSVSANTSYPLNSMLLTLSQRDTLNAKYKVRLTYHLNNILVRDSTNTKIGLTLSTNVNQTTMSRLLDDNGDYVTGVPTASVIMPRGTIIHGTNENATPEDRKMTLQIFYTETK